MISERSFFVPGKPEGKGRPRATARGGFARMYTPANTRAYENKIALCYSADNIGVKPIEAGRVIRLTVLAVFDQPASWSKKRKADTHYHTSKPDADNILKAVCDGLNGIAWADDSQVAIVAMTKEYWHNDSGFDVGLHVVIDAIS